MISDIFLFPSPMNYFNIDILKASFYKNAIFVSDKNYASEIVDTFATIELEDNISTIFKIDALLNYPKELKNIKKTNFNSHLQYSFSKSFSTLQALLNKL